MRYGSASSNHVRCSVTGSSQSNCPSSTNMARAAAVMALVVEPIENKGVLIDGDVATEFRGAEARLIDGLAVP